MEDFSINGISVDSRSTHVQMQRGGAIGEETVLRSLNIILNRNNYPVLVVCSSGRSLTGNSNEVLLIMVYTL